MPSPLASFPDHHHAMQAHGFSRGYLTHNTNTITNSTPTREPPEGAASLLYATSLNKSIPTTLYQYPPLPHHPVQQSPKPHLPTSTTTYLSHPIRPTITTLSDLSQPPKHSIIAHSKPLPHTTAIPLHNYPSPPSQQPLTPTQQNPEPAHHHNHLSHTKTSPYNHSSLTPPTPTLPSPRQIPL